LGGYFSRRPDSLAWVPQGTAPQLLSQIRQFAEKNVGQLTAKNLHDPSGREGGLCAYKKVHVIGHDFAADDFNPSRFAQLLEELLDPIVNWRNQYWFAILG